MQLVRFSVARLFHILVQISFIRLNDLLTSEVDRGMIARIIYNPTGIYMLKVNNRNTRTRCEICSKLTIKTPERRHWRRSGVFIVNFEHDLVLTFL